MLVQYAHGDNVLLSFFFVKQKTAYEMRISDWSSDVCSSDLWAGRHRDGALARPVRNEDAHPNGRRHDRQRRPFGQRHLHAMGAVSGLWRDDGIPRPRRAVLALDGQRHRLVRSEEHTSELQSLMRISYAVFCLKKKKPTTNRRTR